MKASTSKRQLVRESIRQLHIQDGQILLVKRGSPLGNEDSLKALAGIFHRQNRSNCILIVVDDFNDLAVINPQQMNAAGWYRMEESEDGTITIYQDSSDGERDGAGEPDRGVLHTAEADQVARGADSPAGN